MSDVWAVLGENRSDAETLKALLKLIKRDERITVRTKGYDGGGELLRKGARQLTLFAGLGCTRFVVCHDADRHNPRAVYQRVTAQIVRPSGLSSSSCVVVPVQEIEAWILADIRAVNRIITSWTPPEIPDPESIDSPKEYLNRLSEGSNRKPRYDHATHNPAVAKYLNPAEILRKCNSFREFYEFLSC